MLGKVLFLLLLMLDCSLCLCPDSYSPTPDGKHCMNMSENALVTRNNAQQMCQNENAYLAVIKDAFMNNYVYSSIKNGVFPIWIGAKCYSSVPSSCYWDADSSTMNYHNFGAGEPFPERGNCIFMSIDPDRRGQWYSDDCDARRYYYACEKSVAENPTNYKIQGHYYDVTADDVLGIEKSRKDFLPQERKIASWLSSILDTDYVDFYVEYFEIHGAAAGFPTAIYFGYLTTNGITKRNDLIKNLELPPTTSVYLVMPVYSVPPPPPLTGNNINNLNSNASCQNFGIFNGYNCSCSAECYDSQCQPEKCAGNKTGLKPVSQSMILVVSLRSSISSDIQTLIDAVPYLLHQLKATINGFTNYIITTFRQR